MRWFFTAFLWVVSSAALASDNLEASVRTEWEASGVPGMAYAVLDSEGIQAGAFGEIRDGSSTPVTADTPFAIGSISKSFTALAILQMVEAGQVELDARISIYLPEFAGGPAEAVTLRQLLSHTSGFSTRQGNVDHDSSDASETVLRDTVTQMAAWQPNHEPGLSWAYSNANYLILGAVIEAVTGHTYADYIEREILTPLGMDNSRVADGTSHPDMAVPHVPWFRSWRALEEAGRDRLYAPAGGVIASARDLALYLGMMLNGQDDLISAEHKTLMMTPVGGVASFYGLGWYTDTQNGLVSHTGLTPGVETLAMMRLDEGTAAIVFVNASGGLGFHETGRVRYAVALEALGMEYQPDGGVWGRRGLTLSFWILPVLFVVGTIVAWAKRAGLRAKSGLNGAFSLWFPLLVSLVLAWVCLSLIPGLFGVSLSTLSIYQPDWVLSLWASAITGLVWAVFRLCVYYTPAKTLASTD